MLKSSTAHSRKGKNLCRGLVACANAGESDSSNGSQFVITTERADELTRKYTIFGRISGETIFTVLRMLSLIHI